MALVPPDFWELKTGYPYIHHQAEYVISGAASHIFCVLAAQDLLDGDGNN